MRRFVLVVLGVCLTMGYASAQTFASLTGEVRDPSGAVVPNVSVTATNAGTNAVRQTTTDVSGIYAIPDLVPGIYTIKAVARGFRTVERPNVELQVQQTGRVDFTLQVGQATQTVEVSGTTELLATESATVGTVIAQQQIVDLPLNGRQYLQLVALSPNVNTNFQPAGQVSGREGGLRSNVNISISGYRATWNNFTLDGIANTDPDFNTYVQSPSIDMLQEFKVQSGVYPAEFGWEAGQVNVSTKSGTNSYHGSVYEFLRNDFFDAKNYDFTNVEQPKGLYQQNQYGFVFGGPIWIPKVYNGRDKLFFMSNYERFTYNNTVETIYTMPPAAWFTGDLSSALSGSKPVQLYNPSTGAPFPNNQIPSTMFNSASVAYMQYWPKANLTTPTVANNYQNPQTTKETFEQFNQRIDFNQSANSQWFGRYSWTNEVSVTPSLPKEGSTLFTGSRQYMFANIHEFSATKVNEFRFGETTFNNILGQQLAGVTNVDAQMGLNIPLIPTVWGVPLLQQLAGGLSAPGNSTNGPYVVNDKIFQIVDNFSWVRGKHTIRMGGELRYTIFKQTGQEYARGAFSFSGVYTAGPPPAGSAASSASASAASSFADFLLGDLSSASLAVSIAKTDFTANGFGLYVDDTYKLTSKLTLDLGLRYEMMQPWKDLDGDEVNYQFPVFPTSFTGNLPASDQPVMVRAGIGNFYDGINFRYPGILVARDGRLGARLETTPWNDVAPRVGIAWSPASKWSVRAGFGVFYSQESGNSRFDLARNLSGRATTADSSAGYVAGPPTLNWQNFYNPATLPYTLSSNGLTWGMNPNLRTPYSMVDELNIQRQLGENTTLEVGYNGINSRKLQNLVNADPGVPCGTAVCAAGGSVTNPTNRAPFPAEAVGGIQYLQGNGDANYNGMGIKLTQRNFHGFTTIAAYTWSRALDFGSAIRGTDGDQFAENPYCIKCEYGPSAFNADNRFVISVIYDVPVGRGKSVDVQNRFLDALVGGWELNGIFTDQNGQPMDPQGWDAAGQVVVPNSNRLDYVGDPNLPRGTRSIHEWFNTPAFTEPLPSPTGAFGTAGRNSLVGPSFSDLDFAMHKNFRITERQSLQFRWENFNFVNHPQFGTPNDMYGATAYTATPAASFNTITTMANNNFATMRQMQFALKYIF